MLIYEKHVVGNASHVDGFKQLYIYSFNSETSIPVIVYVSDHKNIFAVL